MTSASVIGNDERSRAIRSGNPRPAHRRPRRGAAAGGSPRHLRAAAGRHRRPVRRRARTDYVQASLAAWTDPGPATAIGHPQRLSAAGAAFINGTAAHGEDFDDTFEGGPVHAGAVIVPAVLAAAEQEQSRRPTGAARHRRRRRDHLPAEPGRAQGRAQGRLPSHRRVRRVAAAAGCRRRPEARRAPARQRAGHRRLHGERHHRVPGRRQLHQAHARRLGRAIGAARRAAGPRRLHGPAHRLRGGAWPVPRFRAHAGGRLRRPDRRLRRALAHARRWPSSPTRAAPWSSPTSTARCG